MNPQTAAFAAAHTAAPTAAGTPKDIAATIRREWEKQALRNRAHDLDVLLEDIDADPMSLLDELLTIGRELGLLPPDHDLGDPEHDAVIDEMNAIFADPSWIETAEERSIDEAIVDAQAAIAADMAAGIVGTGIRGFGDLYDETTGRRVETYGLTDDGWMPQTDENTMIVRAVLDAWIEDGRARAAAEKIAATAVPCPGCGQKITATRDAQGWTTECGGEGEGSCGVAAEGTPETLTAHDAAVEAAKAVGRR